MTTKPREHCKGTGQRAVSPIEAFEDELRARGVWYRWEGGIKEGPEPSGDAAIVLLHRSGASFALDVWDVLGDLKAEAARVQTARDFIEKAGGWEAFERA